jgi:hypothetical protein
MATADTQSLAKSAVASKSQQKVSLLFVLKADTAVIAKDDTGYTLTLKGMDNKVLYFSDRPVRRAGFITMDNLMSDWTKGPNSFQDNPPNAAIVHAALKTNDKGVSQAIPVELTNPVVVEGGVMFHLKDLNGTISMGDYNGVSIFIDDGCFDCGRKDRGTWIYPRGEPLAPPW